MYSLPLDMVPIRLHGEAILEEMISTNLDELTRDVWVIYYFKKC